MSHRTLSRVVTLIAVLAASLWMSLAPASAQLSVDCRNGSYCPSGSACLMNGMCGVMVDRLPGSTQTSTGEWCEPGLRESTSKPGTCIPKDYVDCPSGLSCPPGYYCGQDGRCAGGPPATGPMCGSGQCAAGRICASSGNCMNPAYFQDCGNGTICSKQAACELPKGCVLVGAERTRQIPYSR
jgi:hypothetical protein